MSVRATRFAGAEIRTLRAASLIGSAELLRSPRRTTAAVNWGKTRLQFSGLLPASAGWQATAWGFYRKCGELRQGVRWLSNACGRARSCSWGRSTRAATARRYLSTIRT